MQTIKPIQLFKEGIINKDEKVINDIYRSAQWNKLPAAELLSTALQIVKSEETKSNLKELTEYEQVLNELIKIVEEIERLEGAGADEKEIEKLINKGESLERRYNKLEKEAFSTQSELKEEAFNKLNEYWNRK